MGCLSSQRDAHICCENGHWMLIFTHEFVVAGDVAPPNDITSWFSSQGLGKTLPTALAHAHDIYALGMQVCG